MAFVQMSDGQFEKLIATVKSLAPEPIAIEDSKPKSSLGNCSARFYGQCDQDAVDEFITCIETYKEMEGISDQDALKGLYLCFDTKAKNWWKGVRRDAKTWPDALRLLREYYSPVKPPYQIYLEIFEEKQGSMESIDTFVCKKRALLARLPEGTHDENTELNFIYGLLNIKYRQMIPRLEIKSFKDLLEKGRQVERNQRG